jgi:hypothetical protein
MDVYLTLAHLACYRASPPVHQCNAPFEQSHLLSRTLTYRKLFSVAVNVTLGASISRCILSLSDIPARDIAASETVRCCNIAFKRPLALVSHLIYMYDTVL